MTITGLLRRFAIAYAICLGAGAVATHYLGINGGTGINTVALLISTLCAGTAFIQENTRQLTTREKWQAWAGILAIDSCLQIGITLVMLAPLGGSPPGLPLLLSGGLLFVAAVHGVCTWCAIALTAKFSAKSGIH